MVMYRILQLLLLIALLLPITLRSQNGVGIGTESPIGALEIVSTSGGLTFSRMTQAQRDLLVGAGNATAGTVVYQTNQSPGLYYYDGSQWLQLGGDDLGDHTADQNLRLDDNWLSNDGDNEGIRIDDNGHIGLGTTASADALLYGYSSGNYDAFSFVQTNGMTGERNVFTIEDQDYGGGGQDHSSVLHILKSGDIHSGDDGFSLVEMTMTGTDPGDYKYWLSGRTSENGAPLFGVDITDHDYWSSGGITLGVATNNNGTYSGGNFRVHPDGSTAIGSTTVTSGSMLDVSGKSRTTTFQMTAGATSGYLLQSDASGNASWVDPSTLSGGGTDEQTLSFSGTSLSITNGNTVNLSGLQDNLGNHTTTQNIQLTSGTWISQDGDDEGIRVNSDGRVTVQSDGVSSGHSGQLKVRSTDSNPTVLSVYGGKDDYLNFAITNDAADDGEMYIVVGDNLDEPLYFGRDNHTTPANMVDIIDMTMYNGNLGIGPNFTNPTSRLHVQGTTRTESFRMTDGATNGYILQSDANGNASWVDPATVTTAGGGSSSSLWVENNNSLKPANSGTSISGTGQYSLAAGRDHTISGGYSGVFGQSNEITSTHSFAAGKDVNIYAQYSGGFGQSNTINNSHSFVAGRNNTVSTQYAAAFGENNSVTNSHSFAAGKDHTIPTQYSAAFGDDQNITNQYSFAAGREHNVTTQYATAFGYRNNITNTYAFAAGRDHVVGGQYAAAFGEDHDLKSQHSFAAGKDHVIEGNYGVAFGDDHEVKGYNATAFGRDNKSNGSYTFVAGRNSEASSQYAVAIGYKAEAKHNGAFVICDDNNKTLSSSTNREFVAGFSSGFELYTNSNYNVGVQLNGGATSWTTTSDARLKKEVRSLNSNSGLAAVLQLRPVSYYYTSDTLNEHPTLGFIAQEVERVVPTVVDTPDDDDVYYGIRYTELIPVLTKAIQEQQRQNDALTTEVAQLKSKVADLEKLTAEYAQLRKDVENLKKAFKEQKKK